MTPFLSTDSGQARTSGTSRLVLALSVCFTVLLSSCAVSTNEGVQALPTENREDLINGTTRTTTVPEPEEDETPVPVDLYFVSNEQLERVTRDFAPGSRVGNVLDALVQGPLPEEVADIPTLNTRITEALGPSADGKADETGTQTIIVRSEADLRSTIEQEAGNARLIVSQIVCTVVNEIDRISGVRIVDETGEAIEVSSESGELISGPARASHFNDCKTGRDILDEQIEEQTESSTTTT